MARCDVCGSRCRGRYCEICGPMERQGDRQRESEMIQAYLSEGGPHRCDLCGNVVSSKAALARDCSEHGPGGACA